MDVIEEMADKYVEQHPDLVTNEQAKRMLDVIRAERGETATVNDAVLEDADGAAGHAGSSRRLTKAEMEALLAKRIELMKSGGGEDNPTDQWRAFSYITSRLQDDGAPLRLMVQAPFLLKPLLVFLRMASLQASAGTGKSFLLTTVFLWCILNDMDAKACAPTGGYALFLKIVKW